MENNLKTLLATPIEVEVALPHGNTIDLQFTQVNLSKREQFRQKWGDRKINEAIANLDLEVLTQMLFILMPKVEKEKLDSPEIKKMFLDYDEDDNEINTAPKRLDRLRAILSQDVESLIRLVMAVFGTSVEEAAARQKEFDQMPEDKKKETLDVIKKLTGQDFSSVFLEKQDGQSIKSES